MFLQEGLLPQHLPVEHENPRGEVEQRDQVGEDEELPEQDAGECHVDGIAAECENSRGDQPTRALHVDTHAETTPEGDQAPCHQAQPEQAEDHANPGKYLRMEEDSIKSGHPKA